MAKDEGLEILGAIAVTRADEETDSAPMTKPRRNGIGAY
jgi:hypothetical protein